MAATAPLGPRFMRRVTELQMSVTELMGVTELMSVTELEMS